MEACVFILCHSLYIVSASELRCFLGRLSSEFQDYKSTIIERLTSDNSLQAFKSIKDYNLYWPDKSGGGKNDNCIKEMNLRVLPPPRKRARLEVQ